MRIPSFLALHLGVDGALPLSAFFPFQPRREIPGAIPQFLAVYFQPDPLEMAARRNAYEFACVSLIVERTCEAFRQLGAAAVRTSMALRLPPWEQLAARGKRGFVAFDYNEPQAYPSPLAGDWTPPHEQPGALINFEIPGLTVQPCDHGGDIPLRQVGNDWRCLRCGEVAEAVAELCPKCYSPHAAGEPCAPCYHDRREVLRTVDCREGVRCLDCGEIVVPMRDASHLYRPDGFESLPGVRLVFPDVDPKFYDNDA